MTTFTWHPAPGAAKDITPRVRRASFGDGYVQRVGDGINRQPASWSLTFTREAAEIDAIEAFLVARAGAESFDWTDPDADAGKYICEGWHRAEHGRGIATLTATFVQVYGE